LERIDLEANNIKNALNKSQAYQTGFNSSLVTTRTDLFLVVLLLALSGNPVVMGQPFIDLILIGVAVFLGVLVFVHHKRFFTKRFFVAVGLFGTILLVQCVQLSFYPIITIAGFYTRLFIGYAIYRLVKNFPLVYVRAMFYLAILSLVLYVSREISSFSGFDIMSVLGPLEKIFGMLESRASFKLLLHTFPKTIGNQHRNAGMFWEPGAFAGYLILALIFLAFLKNDLPKPGYRRYLFILSGTLLTTLSTTGFIAFMLVPLLHYDWHSHSKLHTIGRFLVGIYLVIPLLVGGFLYAYNNIHFLKEKISTQLYSLEVRKTGWHRGRVGSLIFDMEYIQRRPLTGWGLHSQTRYSLHPWMEESEGMGNGMSDFTAKFGISGMVIWLFMTFQRMRILSGRRVAKSLLVMGIILLVLQGEAFLGFPLFLGLMFLYVPRYSRYKDHKSTVSGVI